MALASTFLSAVGDLLVLITLIVALKALKTVNRTRTEALDADETASRARSEAANREKAAAVAAAKRDEAATERAAAQAHEAFLERRYERVLTVGQLVEYIYWAIKPFHEPGTSVTDVPNEKWMPQRNGLRHRLVGLNEALPSCQLIVNARNADQALRACVGSRSEVEDELKRIDDRLDARRTAPGRRSP